MIKLLISATLFIGLGLVIFSLHMPYYTDVIKKEKLETDVNDHILSTGGKGYDNVKDNYYAAVNKLKTNKNYYFDLGSGLSVAAFCILTFLFNLKINKINDFLKIKSFSKKLIFVTAISIWLLLIPGSFWYYSFRGTRGDYPMFADSIAIPIMYGSIAILVGLILLIMFLIITTRKGLFPTYIFISYNAYNKWHILIEVFWGVLLLLCLQSLIELIVDGDHVGITVNLFFIYLAFVLRAGQINAFNEEKPKFQNSILTNS